MPVTCLGWTNLPQEALSQIAFGGAHRCDFPRLILVLWRRMPGKNAKCIAISGSRATGKVAEGIVAFQRQLLPSDSDSGRRWEAAQTLISSMASYSQLE